MKLLLAGTCAIGLFAGVMTAFLLMIPAIGDSRMALWRQTHTRLYQNSLEIAAAAVLVVLLILSATAAWLILR